MFVFWIMSAGNHRKHISLQTFYIYSVLMYIPISYGRTTIPCKLPHANPFSVVHFTQKKIIFLKKRQNIE